ncbi:MAG: 5'-methylthioadenosine/adenosylhomocysteine nucleosidase [Oscillospiraceae bacterium]|nr:5'-methylthioadenosine/adenosylhomocysteine nucleosidase [Oscillospiraceae bacterium]
MTIGIIGAMRVEVEALKELMTVERTHTVAGIEFCYGLLEERWVVVAESGIGKINSAACTQIMILVFSPDMIINTGVAGGIGDNIKIGDIVVGESVVQHDFDLTPVGDPAGLIPGMQDIKIPCSERLSKLLRRSAELPDTDVHTGVIATGDQFITGNTRFREIRDTFGAIAVEMEGGSIGQVCALNKVEYGAIRCISDNAGTDSHMEYAEFVGIAADKSVKIVTNFLRQLTDVK